MKERDLLRRIRFFTEEEEENTNELYNNDSVEGEDSTPAESAPPESAPTIDELMNEGKSKESNFGVGDADENELKMGMEVEKEHSSNEDIARKIALDHLAEIPDYYTRLKKMEDEAKKGSEEKKIGGEEKPKEVDTKKPEKKGVEKIGEIPVKQPKISTDYNG